MGIVTWKGILDSGESDKQNGWNSIRAHKTEFPWLNLEMLVSAKINHSTRLLPAFSHTITDNGNTYFHGHTCALSHLYPLANPTPPCTLLPALINSHVTHLVSNIYPPIIYANCDQQQCLFLWPPPHALLSLPSSKSCPSFTIATCTDQQPHHLHSKHLFFHSYIIPY